MEPAVPTSSTPLRSAQLLGTDFDQRPYLDTFKQTIEEILAPDVLAEVREALKQDWFITELDEHRRELERTWQLPDLARHRSKMIRLYKTFQEGDYRLQSAAVHDADFDGLAIIGGIWKTWADALGRLPQFQLNDFFAVPIGVTKKTAKTVPEILYAHKRICSHVQEMLEKKEVSAKTNPKYFRLHPLCEALLVVFDEYKFVESSYLRQADGFRHYDNVAQDQSVLLVRTGQEDKLSAPISFNSLKHKALPLARNEDMEIIDIIRVPLQVGVRFVATLQLREEAAFPESALSGLDISQESDHRFVQYEEDMFAWRKRELIDALEQGKISSSSTASDMKEIWLLNKNPHEFDLEFYAPPPGKFNWV